MTKDGQLIRTLFGMWDGNCWLAKEPKRYRGRSRPWMGFGHHGGDDDDGPPRRVGKRSSFGGKSHKGVSRRGGGKHPRKSVRM